MAQIMGPEFMALANIVESTEPMSFVGNRFWIPIKPPERVAWDAAVRWLEERKAADEEWPWPKRDYRRYREASHEEHLHAHREYARALETKNLYTQPRWWVPS